MSRFKQVMTAVLLCCALAAPVAAQGRGQGRPDDGPKPQRNIPREPKGDSGNRGGNQDRPRDNGGRGDSNRGNNGGGRHRDRPNEF